MPWSSSDVVGNRRAKFWLLDQTVDHDAWVTDASANPATSPPIRNHCVQHRRIAGNLAAGTARLRAHRQRRNSGTAAQPLRHPARRSPARRLALYGQARRAARRGAAADVERSRDPDRPVPVSCTDGRRKSGHRQEAQRRARADHIRDFLQNSHSAARSSAAAFRGALPLAHFLTETRRGHCEYFATAGRAAARSRHSGATRSATW